MSRIAYVVSQYPAPSHTFIRREIAALRQRNLAVCPFSIRPGLGGNKGQVPAVLAQPWYLFLWFAACGAMRAPARTANTWMLAQRHRPAGARGWIWAQFHFVEALVLATMLQRTCVERVHSHFANSGATVAMLAARQLGLPWSLTLHGISETDAPAGALLAEKIGRAEFVACASWYMRAQGMRLVPPDAWPKLHIVRCGVDLSQTAPSEREMSNSRLHFVAVGRISAEKGYPGLVEAFRNLIARGIDADLAIVGDGPLREAVEGGFARAQLSERVKFHGFLSEQDTLSVMATSDVFVLPSLMEGLPVVLMEAMALQKPVVAANVAGIPELVQENQTGLLFRPGDWKGLSSCLYRLATNFEMRRRLGIAARRFVEKEFDIHRAVEPLVALLDP